MSLFWATFLTGLLLAAFGALLIAKPRAVKPMLQAFPRSERATIVTLALASAWFLGHILNLSEADFGNYRIPLFAGFAAIAVMSYFHVREFLAVRALAVLVLLAAQVLLTAAFMQEPGTRLFLVVFVYLAILAALYLGASPFRLRDFFQWLYATPRRAQLVGGVFGAYGLLLLLVALTYP